MRHVLVLLVLLFTALLQVRAQNRFISPKYHSVPAPGKYAGVSRWPLGSSQLIAFQASWDEYTIELWQQNLGGSGASLSSTLVYSQGDGDDLAQSFYWTVQTYDLQLSDSPVFFFWLRDSQSEAQQTSAYFNITINTPSSSTTPTATLTTNVNSSPTSSPTLSSTIASTVPSGITDSPETSSGGKAAPGLSTGAAAGVGVAVSLGVIALASAIAFAYFRRRRRQLKQQPQVELQGGAQGPGPISFTYDPPKTASIPGYGQSLAGTPRYELSQGEIPGYVQPRAEIPAYELSRAEMPA
ncbi:hypothetical protein SAMD00023353_2600690 [Rosellinia necatrix]|uniref:Mid2 domain-containing protein n=1 Tax=Rosellinia necatrix TaxID=77044 RepID=A0A1W2TH96_ROSNE|nr:hypothetical protein SAMD00023353_2600690 [Rosellinia necatrix]